MYICVAELYFHKLEYFLCIVFLIMLIMGYCI